MSPLAKENTKIWMSEEENAVWYSSEKIECDYCGKIVSEVVNIKINEDDVGVFGCWASGGKNRTCGRELMNITWGHNPDVDPIHIRLIEYRPSKRIDNKRAKKKREPVGLAKRYAVMKKDGFQCRLCGASGKTAKLELDHIIPVAKGGGSEMENLQTLCFKCNRGKRDSE